MAQYCDSVQLERNWFHWLLSTSVPDLEKFRITGVLWTKIPGFDMDPKLADPKTPYLEHCIALATPHHIRSDNGKLNGLCDVWHEDRMCKYPLPSNILDLESDDPLLCLDQPYRQQGIIVPYLKKLGYHHELPTKTSWDAMISDINNTCKGIARKFNPSSDEERDNLAHEALIQVMAKLNSGRLIYTPGKAPVFNLLTTTIHRCMYSIKNRDTKQKKNSNKLAADLRAGILPRSMRSLRVPGSPTIRPYS